MRASECVRRRIKRSVQAWNVRSIHIPFDCARAASLDAKGGFLCGNRDQNSFECDLNNCIHLHTRAF